MITDVDYCNLCVTSYSAKPEAWDFWVHTPNDDDICYGIKRIDDTDVVVFRGSANFLDWRRDFDAWATPFTHPGLGPVHAGFYAGMTAAWTEIQKHLGAKVAVAGHSLGAARACILTGLMLLDGVKPLVRVTFGEPQTGFHKFTDLVSTVPARPYCNGDNKGHDLICDVPYYLPPLAPYEHPVPLISLQATPTPDFWKDLGIFGYHHIGLYLQAIKAKTTT